MKFTKYGNDPNHFFTQENNAIDTFRKKTGEPYWRETCGQTSMCNGAAAVSLENRDRLLKKPEYPLWTPQPEDLLFLWLNDPRNQAILQKVRSLDDSVVPSRVAQYLPVGLKHVFGIDAMFNWGISEKLLIDSLDKGNAVTVWLKMPDHYEVIVGYSDKEFIVNDSWKGRSGNTNGGFNEKIDRASLIRNCNPLRIIHY